AELVRLQLLAGQPPASPRRPGGDAQVRCLVCRLSRAHASCPWARLGAGEQIMPDNEPTDARGRSRLSPRGATCVEVVRAPDGVGPTLAAAVLDVSATGAQLALTESLPAGHVLGVALYGPHGLLPVACAATVVWSQRAADGTFLTGVHFSRSAGEENLV